MLYRDLDVKVEMTSYAIHAVRDQLQRAYMIDFIVQHSFVVKYHLYWYDDGPVQEYWSGETYEDNSDPEHQYTAWSRPEFPTSALTTYLDDTQSLNPLHLPIAVSALRDAASSVASKLRCLVETQGVADMTDTFASKLQGVTGADSARVW